MKKTGIGLVDYAKSKVGTPYFYGSKMKVLTETFMAQMHKQYPSTVTNSYMSKARKKGQVGKINTDCSGLPGAYRGKQIGSYQLYQSAYTRLPIAEHENFAQGVILWRKGHVGVFCRIDGAEKVIEAKGINYGVVVSDFRHKDWTCGLTFADMEYIYEVNLVDKATWKQPNPYPCPVRTLYKGCKGEDVMWLQYELNEAGFNLKVDGSFGPKTEKAVAEFQASAKLKYVDKRVGPETRKALKAS